MEYEYRIMSTDKPTATEEQLNELGKLGWVLLTIYPWEGKHYYYFYRVKSNG